MILMIVVIVILLGGLVAILVVLGDYSQIHGLGTLQVVLGGPFMVSQIRLVLAMCKTNTLPLKLSAFSFTRSSQ